ncbi:hypothetical protein [Xanthocytophaga agilis]|uniref:Lipoprotein n=1 Tax=Xanthocytophaga agilis TaxID=3048010 RepID=A0AAE3R0H1_9BACT|nr:hypothetical protein [Xanthocytophaga agilis]MDJ1501411.1 hypothetical protein [Xanthocytophaga agilis]
MKLTFCLLGIALSGLIGCTNSQTTNTNSISKVEMHLSAFGVESDDFPSIDVIIDFQNDTNSCKKWYYNPAYKDSIYSLSRTDITKVLDLLQSTDLTKLKEEYTVDKTDQPSSKTIIYTNQSTFTINDYGLEADHPLQAIYKIVYQY